MGPGVRRDDGGMVDDFAPITLPHSAVHNQRHHYRVVAADGADARRVASPTSLPKSRNSYGTPMRAKAE